jgi:hypothetical protein
MVLMMASATCIYAQEKKKMVHLKVIRNDQTVVDTSFSANDLEEKGLQKKISELAGIDISLHDDGANYLAYSEGKTSAYYIVSDGHKKGVKKMVIEGDAEKAGQHHYAIVVSEDDTSRIIMKGEKIEVISEDSLKKIKVIGVDEDDLEWVSADSIKKSKSGIWLIKEGEDDLKWITEEGEGDSIKVIIKKLGDEEEVIHIREAGKVKVLRDGDQVMVYDTEGEGHKIIKVKKDAKDEKTYEIYIGTDNEGVKAKKGLATAHVYVDHKKNGTEFESRSVMVKTRKIEGSEDVEIIVTIDEKRNTKTEKNSPESKQKK